MGVFDIVHFLTLMKTIVWNYFEVLNSTSLQSSLKIYSLRGTTQIFEL